MARIDWALLCSRAFLDRHERLCMIGVATRFRVPSPPIAIDEVVLVARIVEVRPGDEVEVGIAISTPCGLWTRPSEPDGFQLEQAGEYLFLTLREVPLVEAGTYRFALALGQQEFVLDVPVTVATSTVGSGVH
jgi:hypothetical protein